MYRQYEDARALEKVLEEKRAKYEELCNEENADFEELLDLHEEIDELEDRVNYAWQDEEYDNSDIFGYDDYPEDYYDGWD